MASDRSFQAAPAKLERSPLLIGLMGPPGGGKTKSALRLADGMRKANGRGPPVLIDTEGGRSLKYAKGPMNPHGHEFLSIMFPPPFKPEDFLAAIRVGLKTNPAAIIVDSASDEHEGEGGVLDWHDEEVPRFKGNEYAAWGRPKASRRKFLAGIQQIADCPLIFCFRAREKTKQEGKAVVQIGLQPIAPLEFVHVLDLACLLPPRAEGVAVWKSGRGQEDFVLKFPEFLAPLIAAGQLNEATGEALGAWALGQGPTDAPEVPHAWVTRLEAVIDGGSDAKALHAALSAAIKEPEWGQFRKAAPAEAQALRDRGVRKVETLKQLDDDDAPDDGPPQDDGEGREF